MISRKARKTHERRLARRKKAQSGNKKTQFDQKVIRRRVNKMRMKQEKEVTND